MLLPLATEDKPRMADPSVWSKQRRTRVPASQRNMSENPGYKIQAPSLPKPGILHPALAVSPSPLHQQAAAQDIRS